MKVEVYLDGILVDEPIGIKDLIQNIEYRMEYRSMFTYLSGDLKFIGSGYSFLENKIFNSPCSIVEIKIYIDNKEYFVGNIDISDISELDITKKELSVPLQDNNLSSYITKNSKLKTYINVPKSKTGESITAASSVIVDFFRPSTGSFDFNIPNIYPVGDVLRYLIEWMSDGLLSYSSPLFDSGGDLYGICIVNGFTLSNPPGLAPEISFYDLFNELNKLFNIAMYIDFSASKPKVIIDKYNNIFNTTINKTFNDVKSIKLKFSKDEYYSKVKLGSEKIQEYSNGTFSFPDATFLGFDEEEYFVDGQCNLDNELDLVNKYIIDTNVIEDALVYANDSYKEDTFLIEVDLLTNQVVKYDNLIPLGYVYNLGLANNKKAEYWINSIGNSLKYYYNIPANDFEAEDNSVTLPYGTPTSVLIHPTVIYDTGTNYNSANGRYTAPLDGVYVFDYEWSNVSYSLAPGSTAANVLLAAYDSGGIFKFWVIMNTFVSTVGDLGGSSSAAFYLQAGDYVQLESIVYGLTTTVSYSIGKFKGQYANEGDLFQAYDPNNIKVYEFTIETPTTFSEYENIKNNISKKILVKSGINTIGGWVKKLERNILTGMTKITLKSSNNDNLKRIISR